MTIEQIASIGEVIGAVAVVISLVFLAIELRRNTKTMRASSAFDSEQAFASINQVIFADEKIALLAMRAHSAEARPEDYSESDWAQIYFLFRACMQVTQAQWFLKQEGLMSEEIWMMRATWAKGWIQTPVFSTVWKQDCEKEVFVKSFIDEIEGSRNSDQIITAPQSGKPNVT
jgi:hypothetical protein